MSDHVRMFSLISLIAAFGVLDVLALRYGADSRRDRGRQL
jgi:predicted outer membrane lipoprotein